MSEEQKDALSAERILNPYIVTEGHGYALKSIVWEHLAIKAMKEYASQQTTKLERELLEWKAFAAVNDVELEVLKHRLIKKQSELEDMKEALQDTQRLTKKIDIIINGKDAAEYPSLCDVIKSVEDLKYKTDKLYHALLYARALSLSVRGEFTENEHIAWQQQVTDVVNEFQTQ